MALHVAGLGASLSPGQVAQLRGSRTAPGASSTPSSTRPPLRTVAGQPAANITASVGQAFEQALELNWHSVPSDAFEEFIVEVVYDNSDPKRSKTDPEKELVQKVEAGTDTKACVRGLPAGRRFLVTVIGRMQGNLFVRTPWLRATTLAHKDRPDKQQNLDPKMKPRMQCYSCACSCYVSFPSSTSQSRCRRCGCSCWDHASYDSDEVLRNREARARKRMGLAKVKELPDEAIDWDDRECELWFCTAGAFHPRNDVTGDRRPEGGSLPGLVSVVTPTTEGRQHFHLWLWSCFAAQSWADKELVVVETYTENPSQFFQHMAKSDPRLVYFAVKIKEEDGKDWSIGVKRNIGNHLAKGEFIASFDDDDLYAPDYLSTMVSAMEERKGLAIKLSSWYIFRTANCNWGFCDPIAWGLSRGMDLTDTLVNKFTYGYGFSYVYRRQLALEVWFEDINFGEDFAFLSQVRRRKGDESVLLLRDDSGICLHVQHGSNTSNSIPLRDVPRDEALDTAVMELSAHFATLRLTQIDSHPAGLFFGMKDPPSKRVRKVRVHTPDNEEVFVKCWTNATSEDFLKVLWHQTGQFIPWQVYRVPPSGWAEEEKRDIIAALLLGIAFLADLPGAWMNLLPETSSGEQWRRLLEEAKRPLRPSDRLGLRTTSIWLLPPEDNCEGALEEEIISEDYILVNASCQKANAKQFCSKFMVWLPRGSTVELLRAVLGRSLPPQGRILIERPGKGMAVLQNGEVVPDRIIVSEYKSDQPFHLFLTRDQAKVILLLMRKFSPDPGMQRQFDEMERESRGISAIKRALLGKILRAELYPSICRYLGLPENALEPQMVSEQLGKHIGGDLEISHLWLEVDWWIRHWDGVTSAFHAINTHRKVWGLEPLTDIMALDPTRKAGFGQAQSERGGQVPLPEEVTAAATVVAAAAVAAATVPTPAEGADASVPVGPDAVSVPPPQQQPQAGPVEERTAEREGANAGVPLGMGAASAPPPQQPAQAGTCEECATESGGADAGVPPGPGATSAPPPPQPPEAGTCEERAAERGGADAGAPLGLGAASAPPPQQPAQAGTCEECATESGGADAGVPPGPGATSAPPPPQPPEAGTCEERAAEQGGPAAAAEPPSPRGVDPIFDFSELPEEL
mmetsp:Transcript_14923/g.46734  ORF Transcript_14923/g.46734 Transcript_14923/m.46734 type:complete len:1137 (-) Transcript_14923:126-3536(-)